MAFPAVQSSSTGSRTSNSGPFGTAIRVSMPAGVQVGDLLIAHGAGNSNLPTPLTSGWNALTTVGDVNNVKAYWKIADSGDLGATQDWTALAGSANTEAAEIGIVRITGHDPVNPIQQSHFTSSGSGGTTVNDSGITPTPLQCLFLILAAGSNSTAARTTSGYAVANNNPSWAEVFDADSAGSAGSNHTLAALASANQTSSPGNATGNATAVFSGSESNYLVGIVAIAPAITLTAPTQALTSTLIVPAFVRGIVAPIISIISTFIAPAVSTVLKKWSNQSKSTSAWNNQSKTP